MKMSLLEFAFPIATFQDITNECAAICQGEFFVTLKYNYSVLNTLF